MKIKILITALLTIVMTNSINAQNKSNAPKDLVAYFSRSGNTRKIANEIKDTTRAIFCQIETVKTKSQHTNKS